MDFGRVFLSAGLAFIMSILVALLIEQFGGAIGSAIGTIPSTILPASYIMMTNHAIPEETRMESLLGCVYGVFATDIIFIPSWRWVPNLIPKSWRKGWQVTVETVVTLVLWFIGAVAVTLLQQLLEKVGLPMILFCLFLMIFTLSCGVALCWSLPPTPAGRNHVKWYIHMIRGLASGLAIFFSGIMSQSGLGVAAGAMSTFPAIFCATIVSVSLAQGPEVITGALGPLLIGGMAAGWYSIVCALCYYWYHLHPGWCLLISWLVSVFFWTIPVYYFVKWRRDVTQRKTLRMVAQMEAENTMIEMKEVKDSNEVNDLKNTPSTKSEKPVKENEDLVETNSIVPPREVSTQSSEPQSIVVTPITEDDKVVSTDLSTEIKVVTTQE